MKNRLSQKDKVLKEMRQNGYITRNFCLQNYISRLGAIIYSLKKEGMNITAEWKDNDYKYVLHDKPKDVIVYTVRDTGQKIEKVIW